VSNEATRGTRCPEPLRFMQPLREAAVSSA